MNDVVFDIAESLTTAGQAAEKDLPPKTPAAGAREKLSNRKERKAKAAQLSPKQRTAIGKKAAAARWGKA